MTSSRRSRRQPGPRRKPRHLETLRARRAARIGGRGRLGLAALHGLRRCADGRASNRATRWSSNAAIRCQVVGALAQRRAWTSGIASNGRRSRANSARPTSCRSANTSSNRACRRATCSRRLRDGKVISRRFTIVEAGPSATCAPRSRATRSCSTKPATLDRRRADGEARSRGPASGRALPAGNLPVRPRRQRPGHPAPRP